MCDLQMIMANAHVRNACITFENRVAVGEIVFVYLVLFLFSLRFILKA